MPYLVLKYINFFNFKSFDGHVFVGPLGKSMNCVLGPNGAGKSNIIDGILFVFGKNAKSMRTKNMTELIHNMGRVERDRAYVELEFVEIQGKVEVPDSDFKIRRTVLRNGTTSYEYNGQKTEKQFIQDLLSEKGIDMESDRYLVLQGEIEQLALMKPTSFGNHDEPGFIEYIELVSGSIKFLEPIKQQESKMQTLLIELQMVRDQHRLLTTEIDGLQLAVQPTLNYFEAQTSRNRNRYITQKIKELGYIQEITYRFENTFLEFIKQKDLLEVKHKSILSEMRILNEQIKDSEIKRETISQKVDIVRDQMEQIQENDNQERQNAKETMLRLEKYNKLIKDSGDIQRKLFEDEQNYTQTYQNSELKLKQFKDQLAPIKKEVIQFDQQQDDQRYKLNEQIRLNDVLLRGCTKNYNDQQRICEQIKKQIQQIVIPDVSQLKMYKKDLESNKENQKQVRAILEQLGTLRDEIEKQHFEKTNIFTKEKNQLLMNQSRLKILMDSVRVNVVQNDNEDRDLLTLQQLYNQNKIQKVYFRLCSAGLIDTKYENALSVAMGIGASIFVMDSMADGLDMLAYLKQNKIQTNNIKVIGKDLDEKLMEQCRNRPRESKIPGLTRLMDLIQFNENWVEPLFFKFLKNNYFCETIEQATQIRKQYDIYEQIYTLKGEISKGRGDMKTASLYKKGYWQTQGEQNKVLDIPDQQQEQVKYLEQQIYQLKLSKDALEKEISSFVIDLKSTDTQIEDIQLKLNGLIDLEKKYEQQIADLSSKEKQIPILKQKNADLETKLVEEQTKLKQYENELAIKTQIKNNLDKQIFEIDPPGIREKRQLIIEQEKKISETEKALNQSQINATNCGRKLQELLIEVQRANDDIIECQRSLEQSEINYKEAERLIKELFSVVNDDVVAMDALDNYLDQLYKQKEEFNLKTHNIQMELLQLKSEMDQSMQVHQEQQEFVEQIEYQYQKIRENQKQLIQLYQRDSMDELFNWNQHMLQENKELVELDPKQQLDSPENLEQYFKIKSILNNIPDVIKPLLITKVDKELTEQDLELYKNENDSISEFLNLCDRRYLNRPDENSIAIYKEFKNMVLQLKAYKQNYEQIVYDILSANNEKLELEEERKRVLVSGVLQISSKLQDYYRILSRGTGTAALEPTNQAQILQGGIDIVVKPPGKPQRSISQLSGGEKTMASLALLFAIHFTHPNKVYFLDEIDAALDQANLTSMISFLIAIAGHSQFIIVSHRQVIQDNCDKLFGVMKINNQTLIIGASVPISRVRTIAEMKVKMVETKIKGNQQFQNSLQDKEQVTEFGKIESLQTAVSTQQNMVDIFLVRQLEEEFERDQGINFQQKNYEIQRVMSKTKDADKLTATKELQDLQDGWKEDEVSDDDYEEQKVKASKRLRKRIARFK